jgi:molybdopterin-containing oxidoreductase family iron-sulfur binding subunit
MTLARSTSLPVHGGGAAAKETADEKLVPAAMLSRRRFVEWMGVGIATLGLEACSKPPRGDIVPYVRRPPEVTPGVASSYATSSTRRGHAVGLLVESHEGRPTKIEGHPDHPASLGSAGVREQASIFSLYDPDRAKAFRRGIEPSTWQDFALQFGPRGKEPWMARRGEGAALVLEPSASPLRAALVDALLERYPALMVFHHSTSELGSDWEGSRRAFGKVLDPHYRLENADVVVSLDADPFTEHPMSLALSRAFAERRKAVRPGGSSNRLYAVEGAMSLTGAAAEHRLAVRPSEIGAIAAALLAATAPATLSPEMLGITQRARRFLTESKHRAWLEATARDLMQHRGRSLVLVGERQSAEVHALGYALNAIIGAPGATLHFAHPVLPDAGGRSYALDGLLTGLDAGHVDTLFVLGPNPAYTLPADAEWTRRARKARERVHLSLYENETSGDSTWFVPGSHFLEHWGDGRAYDGTVSFVQPLIEPLHGGKSVDEALAALLGEFEHDARRLLEEHWAGKLPGRSSETTLDEALAHGLLHDSSSPPVVPAMDWAAIGSALDVTTPASIGIEASIRLDSRLGDGESANTPWLQELAEPLTKIVWGNAALLGVHTAEAHGLVDGDVVELRRGDRRVTLPALVDRGHAEGCVTLSLGHGRRAGGRVAIGVGTDVTPLRSMKTPWLVDDVVLAKTGRREPLVRTQTESDQHDRHLVLRRTLAGWSKEPDFAREYQKDPVSILPERLSGSPQWGMAIDLDACIGCSACMIACAVENNIPVVGKENVAIGREMYWIRIDRYYGGSAETPVVAFEPMMCQHCEKAPCEYVCPVNATVHSPDGLNEMVYNRCVGTRFCSNNCPYKVRRFNFFDYNQDVAATVRLGKNPDVTVRARGVMEKCTYCVQRIRRAQIDAEVAKRPLIDGDVTTACEQACPTRAIVFGDVSDPGSRVTKLHADPRTYAVLGDVGTRPRTRYLARIDNPNPELET